MNPFFQWLMGIIQGLRPFVIVLPWEQAVRVRLGSRVRLIGPGLHLKLPWLDVVTLFNSRLRVALSTQTLTTEDGHILTIALLIGFRIVDPLTAMLRMQQPETTCGSLAASAAAGFVQSKTKVALACVELERHVMSSLSTDGMGVEFDFVRVRDFAYAKAYRFLQETTYSGGAVHIEERSP